MSWIKRLKQVAGWDLFLEILAVGVLIALGAFTLMTESCQGEANAHTHVGRADVQASAEGGHEAVGLAGQDGRSSPGVWAPGWNRALP